MAIAAIGPRRGAGAVGMPRNAGATQQPTIRSAAEQRQYPPEGGLPVGEGHSGPEVRSGFVAVFVVGDLFTDVDGEVGQCRVQFNVLPDGSRYVPGVQE